MKLCETNFIRNNITTLSQRTMIGSVLLANLSEKEFIESQDRETLEYGLPSTGKSRFLYEKIIEAKGSHTISTLIGILRNHAQTGAVQELEKYSCIECASGKGECLPDGGKWFGVPIQVGNFTGRVDELERLHELKQRTSSKVTVVTQATTISGMGGIGKTGLAIEYAKKFAKHYQGNILWINADSVEEVQNSYCSLAQKLNIPLKDRSEERRDIKQIKEDIYAYFVGSKCLFVFDNCDDRAFVGKQCIPTTYPASFCTLPKFLLTSRNQEWESDVGVLSLNELKPEEAVELIMTMFHRQEGCLVELSPQESEDVRLLAELLQHFPLAIQQAISYINEQQINNELYTIQNYMTDFKNMSEDMLNKPVNGLGNIYEATTYKTWQISFTKIRENATAANILHMMAYMAPDNAKREVFYCLFPAQDVKDAVKLICKYSLLRGEKRQSVLSIHRLVQEVIRLQLKNSGEREIVLTRCLNLLTSTNLSETNHPAVIWGWASGFPSLTKQFYKVSTAAIERQMTPLHILSQSGDAEGVKSIVIYFQNKSRREEIDRLDCYGRTSLILACEQGHVEVVKILLEYEARTDIMALSVRQRKTFAAPRK